MNPKEYYYNQFPKDLKVLMSKVVVGGDRHFHIVELFFDNTKKQDDKLAFLPKERIAYFLSALAFTILIDQLMFTYFRKEYEKFRSITLYPKITWSIGWCVNVKPWQLFDHRIALARGIRNPEKINIFKEFAVFFVKDLQEFFKENKVIEVDWKKIKSAILSDGDIVHTKLGDGEYGEILKKILEKI